MSRYLVKICWDRDYNTIYYEKDITDSEDVEDNWTGETFYYRLPNTGKFLDKDEAVKYLDYAD